jgi:hypothetical protein
MDVLAQVQLVTCPEPDCGVTFGLITQYYTLRRQDHREFHCPNGHTQYFAQETEDAKRARLAEARARSLAEMVTHYGRRASAAERSNAALRGWATRRAQATVLSDPTDRNES